MELLVRPSRPDAVEAAVLIRAYTEDIVSRWHGRPARPAEVVEAMADEPAHDLVSPQGHFALAHVDGDPVGIGGVRFVDDETAELTKVFTLPAARGRGVASALLDHLEGVAASAGRSAVRLDTRSDLVEACRLYERRGYRRVDAFNDCVYSDRWYARRLEP